MSHVIPLQVFQIMKLGRWNCNVFGWSRKMTEGNYVRLLFGVSPFIEARPGLPVPFAPVLPGVLLCLWRLLSGVRLCLWRRWCSGRRRPLLCEVPEWFPSNVARNSPASISNVEFRTLELQRFRAVSKNDRGKLRATFVWGQSVHRSAARPSGALRAGAAWCFALPVVSSVWCSALPVVPLVFWASVASSLEISEWFPSNVARNSPASISNIEFRTLELQRFRVVSKNDRGKLRATFVWTVTCCSTTRSSTRAR